MNGGPREVLWPDEREAPRRRWRSSPNTANGAANRAERGQTLPVFTASTIAKRRTGARCGALRCPRRESNSHGVAPGGF